jgi:predicted hydrocarbon binding protein
MMQLDIRDRMFLLSILTRSLELFSGDWAKTICYIAGRKMSEIIAIGECKTVEDCLEKMSKSSPWKVDVFEKVNDNEYLVVFKSCPIRQTHYTVCTKQGGALCQVTHGYIESILSSHLKRKVRLILIHAGPNACLKRLVVS